MTKITTYDPFAHLTALQQQFFGDDPFAPFKSASIPTTDVFTKDGKLVIEAHLPNFDQKDIDVQVDGNALTLQAQRHEKEEDKSKKYVVRESSSSFYRRLQLPERADADKVEARLEDGILTVTVPFTPLPEPKKVSIAAKSKKSTATSKPKTGDDSA